MPTTESQLLRLLVGLVLVVLVASCASSPIAPQHAPVVDLGPAHVLEGRAEPGDRVIWGGRIVAIRNRAEVTELSVVSYPLDGADRPRTGREPGVRFLIRQSGFVEPVQYAPGRFVTVLGRVAGIEQATVDEYLLDQPVVDAEQLHLWPAAIERWPSRTHWSIGIGISL
ncbi:MAG: Slp family lipoprotein [Wenzhouxiangella sp.]